MARKQNLSGDVLDFPERPQRHSEPHVIRAARDMAHEAKRLVMAGNCRGALKKIVNVSAQNAYELGRGEPISAGREHRAVLRHIEKAEKMFARRCLCRP